MMADRPLLFQPAMVRALLDGMKIQTRRLLKNPEHWGCPTGDCPHSKQTECEESMAALDPKDIGYAVGDRIWVKETWRTWKDFDRIKPTALPKHCPPTPIFYEADRDNCDRHGKLRVSIHMPRWASRITLNVTDVRVEPLQKCTHADALAEGINCYRFYPSEDHPLCDGYTHVYPDDKKSVLHPSAVAAYAALWNEINGDGSWEANPWVVAISFDVLKRNIDQ